MKRILKLTRWRKRLATNGSGKDPPHSRANAERKGRGAVCEASEPPAFPPAEEKTENSRALRAEHNAHYRHCCWSASTHPEGGCLPQAANREALRNIGNEKT